MTNETMSRTRDPMPHIVDYNAVEKMSGGGQDKTYRLGEHPPEMSFKAGSGSSSGDRAEGWALRMQDISQRRCCNF